MGIVEDRVERESFAAETAWCVRSNFWFQRR
jgi:hypothetical protein